MPEALNHWTVPPWPTYPPIFGRCIPASAALRTACRKVLSPTIGNLVGLVELLGLEQQYRGSLKSSLSVRARKAWIAFASRVYQINTVRSALDCYRSGNITPSRQWCDHLRHAFTRSHLLDGTKRRSGSFRYNRAEISIIVRRRAMTSFIEKLERARARLAQRDADPLREKVTSVTRGVDAISTAAVLDLVGLQPTTGNGRRLAKTMRSLGFVPIKSRRLMPGGYRDTVTRGWARPMRAQSEFGELA